MSHPMKSTAARTLLAATLAALFSVPLLAQSPAPQPLVIDASAPTPAPGPANYTFVAADAKSPSGHILGLNAQYLTLDGKPWLPVMGEIHYSRVPEAEWETEILKMKSAGVQVIAAYIIWIHHEEIEGQWDWAGQKDLRRFVQLCAKHGLYVVPRIGPWSHAEVRNGGFPDWLLAKAPQNRTNDPTYLHFVDLYYQQIAAQLKGLMWSEGGPVIAIQLENEYHNRGPLGGNAHILKLKELARSAGLRVPFYTVTSWDGASIPAGQVLPVGGGYPDAPWDASIEALPPNAVYAFHFGRRAASQHGRHWRSNPHRRSRRTQHHSLHHRRNGRRHADHLPSPPHRLRRRHRRHDARRCSAPASTSTAPTCSTAAKTPTANSPPSRNPSPPTTPTTSP